MGKWRRKLSLAKRWQKNHLIKKYGTICYICGKPMKTIKDMTIDHVIPPCKGGKDDLENYRLVHYICNHTKADMTPEEFKQFQKGELVYD